MWGQGPGTRGYCGETSFQSTGILNGNWISSEIVRRHADGHELLIGECDVKAAIGLKFAFESFPADESAMQGAPFVEWCRQKLDSGAVVVAGFYNNDGNKDAYDHIMPVVGYKKDAAGQTLGLFYNDLMANGVNGPRYFTVPKDILSRSECNLNFPEPHAIPSGAMFAIALLGNAGTDMQPERMKLIIPHNSEPDWGEEDKLNEQPIDMDIKACIAGLTEGLNYVILKFEDPSLVPVKDFVESMRWTKSW